MWWFCTNAAICPWFLGWVILNSQLGINIPYTLPDELSYCVRVSVNFILRGYPEHIPARVIKAMLKRRGIGLRGIYTAVTITKENSLGW